VVVAHDGGESDATTDQEVRHDGLEPSLTRLEIGTADPRAVISGVLHHSRHEGVLRRAVQIQHLGLDRSHAVQNRRWQRLVLLNQSRQVLRLRQLRREHHFGIGSPEDNNFVDHGLHRGDVLLDAFDALSVSAVEHVGHSVGLVGSDELLVHDSWQWLYLLKFRLELIEQIWLQDPGFFGGII